MNDDKYKKLCAFALIAILLALIGYSAAISAQTTADNNANITNVFEIVVNNTNLGPSFLPDVTGTGERVINTTYYANSYPLQLMVFAHGNVVAATAGVFIYINDTLVQPQSGRPLGGAEEAYRDGMVIVPKNASYRVNFTNYHHYEWREYPILSGRNGTLSINATGTNNHALLTNLNWSVAGHVIDSNINMTNNSFIYFTNNNMGTHNGLESSHGNVHTYFHDDTTTNDYMWHADVKDAITCGFSNFTIVSDIFSFYDQEVDCNSSNYLGFDGGLLLRHNNTSYFNVDPTIAQFNETLDMKNNTIINSPSLPNLCIIGGGNVASVSNSLFYNTSENTSATTTNNTIHTITIGNPAVPTNINFTNISTLVQVDVWKNSPGNPLNVRILVNGVDGTNLGAGVSDNIYTTISKTVYVHPGDLVSVYGYVTGGSAWKAKNFYIESVQAFCPVAGNFTSK